jgi:DDE superfamily endonuclease
MWNQSETLGANARHIAPPGINFLGDSGFKIWPFLMVPFDERSRRPLTAKQRCFNYHLSATRILVECVFGKIKSRFKVLHGVTDRKSHKANARMITAAMVMHNLLIDVGDDEQFELINSVAQRRERRTVMNGFDEGWNRSQAEVDLATAKRNMYMERFYAQDYR